MQNNSNITYDVRGMTCGSCVRHINTAVRAVPGVIDVEVFLREGKVSIDFDPARVTQIHIVGAIRGAGYEVDGVASEPQAERSVA